MTPVNILVEGSSDEPVAKKLLLHAGLEVGTVYGKKGKPYLLKRLLNYNQAASFQPWFVLIDLDKELCPSEALQIWLPQPTKGMRCRVAVRAIESWLLADSRNLARFLSVSETKIQQQSPDNYADPKATLIALAKHSSSSAIRTDMVPRLNSGAKVGDLYVPRLNEFTEKFWNPTIAMEHSESLQRCVNALKTLTAWE